ncbi:MAG: hypothetical protein GXO43_06915 [Crenarchaeota archaeon]|nr:hypothetical protein [Thermoproteota archaeon]
MDDLSEKYRALDRIPEEALSTDALGNIVVNTRYIVCREVKQYCIEKKLPTDCDKTYELCMKNDKFYKQIVELMLKDNE